MIPGDSNICTTPNLENKRVHIRAKIKYKNAVADNFTRILVVPFANPLLKCPGKPARNRQEKRKRRVYTKYRKCSQKWLQSFLKAQWRTGQYG
jgi:hypothetical protein